MDIDNLSLLISELQNDIRKNRIRIEELEKKLERNQSDTQEDFREIKERLAKNNTKNMTTSLPIMVQRQSSLIESVVELKISELTSTRENHTISLAEELRNTDDKWSDSEYLREKGGHHMVLQFESSVREWEKNRDIHVTKFNFKTRDSFPVEIIALEKVRIKFVSQKYYVIKYCNVNNTARRVDRKFIFHTTPTTIFKEVCLSSKNEISQVGSLLITTRQTRPGATSLIPMQLSQLETIQPSSQTYAVKNVCVLQENCTMPDGEVHIAINDESTDMEKIVLKVQHGLPVKAGIQMQIENCQILQTKDLVTLISHRDHVKIGDTEVVIKEIPNMILSSEKRRI